MNKTCLIFIFETLLNESENQATDNQFARLDLHNLL